MLPGRPPELDVNSAASLSTSDPAPQSSISGAVLTERESSTRTPSTALDAFSAAAGTGVSTRGGHSDRRRAAHRARRDIRSSRAVTRRTSATPSLDRPAGSNPMPDDAEWSIFWGAMSACRSWVEPFSRYHRRACTRSTSSSGMSQANCATRTPGLLCYGPNKERRCPETERPTGREDRIVLSDGAASHSPDVNPRDSGSITQVPSSRLFAKEQAADPPHAPGQP